MKRLKVILATVLTALALTAPFVSLCVFAAVSPPQYSNTFVGALDEKFERLNSIEEPKIVLIGGSSLAFGIDSELIESYTGMPVVNFGLYASLGTKLMLDLSRSGINSGDIVILAPELDAQTYSLYFNTETTLRAFDGNMSMMRYVGSDNIFSLLGGMWNFASSKLKYMKSGNAPDPEGVYNSKNFNEYGDVVWERSENTMSKYYDPNLMIDPDPDIVTDEFADYVNDYIRFCRYKGATVYFSFSPINEMGLADWADSAALVEFADTVREKINAKQISDITSYVYDAGYFYDTNFHLNDSGVVAHTVNLISDILLELGIPKLVTEDIPPPPSLPEIDIRCSTVDENADYFIYEKDDGTGYRIVGLSELGKTEKSLTVPVAYNGYKVMYIGEGAFSGGAVESVTVTEDTNIRSFENGAFADSELRELVLLYPVAEDILPPADFYGVASGFKVYIPEDSSYESDYYWSERGLTFCKEK